MASSALHFLTLSTARSCLFFSLLRTSGREGCRAAPIRERNQVAQDGVDLSGVAGRYASALYELASDKGQTDEVAGALAAFEALLAESEDLRRLVKSPVFSAQDQVRALKALLSKAEISGVAANFLCLAATKRRLFAVPSMIAAYRRLHDAAKGVRRAEVTVAGPLASAHETELKAALAAVCGGKDVTLDVKIDPSIIGGVIVKLGSRMVDASVKTKLNSIRTRIKEVG
jgi:F-type H+-transporting ATPase subunit delta